MNQFIGEGNLGQDPDLKTVIVGTEPKKVVNLRVYFDRPVADSQGQIEDRKGFWLNVDLWGERAAQLARVCVKGSRVAVVGTLLDDSYERDGATVERMVVRARSVYVVPSARLAPSQETSDVAA